MAIDPPYRLDPFRNIINVRWEEEEPTDGGGTGFSSIFGELFVEWALAGDTRVVLNADPYEIEGFTYQEGENYAYFNVGIGDIGIWPSWSNLSVTWTVTQDGNTIAGPLTADFSNVTLSWQGNPVYRALHIIDISSMNYSGGAPKRAWFTFTITVVEI